VVADFARDMADCAITVAASRDQFIRNSTEDEGRSWMAKGVTPYMVAAVMNGLGDELFDLTKTNLWR
jgi:hypothetical protein